MTGTATPIIDLLWKVPLPERRAFVMRYARPQMTRDDIAAKLGITEAEVCELIARALVRLMNEAHAAGIDLPAMYGHRVKFPVPMPAR